MEPAQFFGFNVETWVGLFMAVLGTVAVVVIARKKKRQWAELGDDEDAIPHDEVQRDHWHDAGGDQHPPR